MDDFMASIHANAVKQLQFDDCVTYINNLDSISDMTEVIDMTNPTINREELFEAIWDSFIGAAERTIAKNRN